MSAPPKGKFRVVGGITSVHPADEFYAVQGEAGDVFALTPRKAAAEFIVEAIRKAQESDE